MTAKVLSLFNTIPTAIDLNRLGREVLAGVLAWTIIGGGGGRLSMRAIALIGGLQAEFTLGGTVAILIIGLILGVIYGGVAWLLGMVLPVSLRVRSASLGLMLAGLSVLPFLGTPEGELALASPWLGAALFAPLPFLAALAAGETSRILAQRALGRPQRLVHPLWLAALAGAAALAFLGMSPLFAEAGRYPLWIWQWMDRLHLGFESARSAGQAVGLIFIVAYVGLTLLLFWMAHDRPAGRLSALILLLLAGAFFGGRGLFVGVMNAIPLASLAAGLLQAGATTGMLYLLFTLPKGRLDLGWTRPVLAVAGVGALFWFLIPGPAQALAGNDAGLIQWAMVTVASLSGLIALGQRYRRAAPAQRAAVGWILVGMVASLGWFLLLWAATLIAPSLRLQGNHPPFTPLAVSFFLLPWLLLPGGLIMAAGRRQRS